MRLLPLFASLMFATEAFGYEHFLAPNKEVAGRQCCVNNTDRSDTFGHQGHRRCDERRPRGRKKLAITFLFWLPR